MAVQVFSQLPIHYHNDDSSLLMGGKLYFYEAGTNNIQAVYTDHLGTVEYVQPVILDVRGEPPTEGIYGDVLKSYKIVLKTASDATLKTVDGYTFPTGGAAGPAGPTGATGARGRTGDTGPAGATGPAGPAGANGTNGANGAKGDTGDTGLQGPIGPQGIPADEGNLVHRTGDESIAGVKSYTDSIYLKTSMYLQANPALPYDTEEFTVYTGGGYASAYLRRSATTSPHDVINLFVGDSSTSTSWKHTASSNQVQIYVAPTNAQLQCNMSNRSAGIQCLDNAGVDQSEVSLSAGSYGFAVQVREDGTQIQNYASTGSDTILLPAPSNLTRTIAMTDQVAMAYNITQGVAALVWIVNHNLGTKPIIQTWNSAGDQIIGTIHHVNVNQTTITFATSQSGAGRCV